MARIFLSSLLLLGALLTTQALQLLPSEQPYTPTPLQALYHTPSRVTQLTVNRLLDVLQNYGLVEHYGVYALHTHLRVGEGEVLYLSQAPAGNFTSITVRPYLDVANDSLPMSHQVLFTPESEEVQLLPIEHAPPTPDALSARQALGTALSNGLLAELSDVMRTTPSNETVALSQILPIHRNALSIGKVVLNQLPDESRQVAVIAPELGGASLGLFTRGLGGTILHRKDEEGSDGCEVAAGCVWRSGVDGDTC